MFLITDRAQLAQARICADLLLNDEPLRNQSGLCYHYPSQLICSHLGQLRSIVLAIMDRAQLAKKRICGDFSLNSELLHNQLGLYYHNPSQLLYQNAGQLRSIAPAIKDRTQLAQKQICVDFLRNDEPSRDQSGLCYHYLSQLLCSNLGQLRYLILAIMDLAQLAEKRICGDFSHNSELLHNQ